MAEKRRFKQNREFKKRLDEKEENEEADIRTFRFRSLEKREFKGDRRDDRRDDRFQKRGGRNDRYSRDDCGDDRYSRDDRKPYRKSENRGGHERFDRSGGKKQRGGGRGFDRNKRRFEDDND